MLTTKQKLWLVYKRLRTAFGVTLGFIVIYAAYTHNFNLALLPVAIGFWCIHLFGDLYNDYVDYEQDIKNDRKDKWVTNGFISISKIKKFSILMLTIGLFSLIFTNLYVFAVGLFYATTIFLYSYPRVYLKKYSLPGYVSVTLPLLFLAPAFNTIFSRQLQLSDLFFTLFIFFNYLYIGSQKDSTDLKDKTNLFLQKGYKSASMFCIFFALISALSLLAISFVPILLLIWFQNLFSKMLNLYKIYTHQITRTHRSKLILLEFLTPYLYAGGASLVI